MVEKKVRLFERTRKWKRSDEVPQPRMLRWLGVPILATHKADDPLIHYRRKKIFIDMIEGLRKAEVNHCY